jgi:hypothetical protein
LYKCAGKPFAEEEEEEIKMLNKVGTQILYVFSLFAYCFFISNRNYISTVPEDKSIHKSDQISVLIGGFQKSRSITTDIPDATNKLEYPCSWGSQWTSVPEDEQESFWTLIVVMFLFTGFFICFQKYLSIRGARSYLEDQKKQLRVTEALIQEYEEGRAKVEKNMGLLMPKLLEGGPHDHSPNEIKCVKKIRKMGLESDAQFQNEVDSTKTVNMEDDCDSQVHKEVHSVEITEEEGEHPGESHNGEDSIKGILLKLIQKFRSECQIEIDSIEIIEEEDHPVGAQNETDSMKLKEEDEPHARFENKMDSTETVTKTVDKVSANFQKDLDPVEASEDDVGRPAYTMNNVDSVKTMAVKFEEEHIPKTVSHKDVLNIMNERLSSILNKKTARDQERTESPVKKTSFKTSIGASEKERKAEMKKVQRLFAPGPSDKATKSKVDYQDTILRHEGIKLKKTYYRKPDYSKIQPKVDTWRKH